MEQTQPQEPAKPKQPNINDYVAGAMLANGVVWVWNQASLFFAQNTNQLIVSFIAEINLIVFTFGSYIASRQVCKRADEKHLLVAIKLAGVSWAMGIFIMFTLPSDPYFNLLMPLLICFTVGSVLGGYMTVRARLRKRRQASS